MGRHLWVSVRCKRTRPLPPSYNPHGQQAELQLQKPASSDDRAFPQDTGSQSCTTLCSLQVGIRGRVSRVFLLGTGELAPTPPWTRRTARSAPERQRYALRGTFPRSALTYIRVFTKMGTYHSNRKGHSWMRTRQKARVVITNGNH